MVWRQGKEGRVAKSILTLFDQLDEAYPKRSAKSDGTLGDAEHLKRGPQSDHNPWYPKPGGGIVTAADITHDPVNGPDIDRLSDELASSRDPRIKYVIANGLILDTRPMFDPWVWQPYGGQNPHTKSLHLSVVSSALADDDGPWLLPSLKGNGAVLTKSDRDAIYDCREQLTGSRSSDPPLYDGWETVAGKLTLPDMVRRLIDETLRERPSRVDGADPAITNTLPELIELIDKATFETKVVVEEISHQADDMEDRLDEIQGMLEELLDSK